MLQSCQILEWVADPETDKSWSYANCGLNCKRLEHTEQHLGDCVWKYTIYNHIVETYHTLPAM